MSLSACKQFHSTEISLSDEIDNGKITALTRLDLSTAFDTIDHDTLMNVYQLGTAYLAQHCAGFLHTRLIDGKPLKWVTVSQIYCPPHVMFPMVMFFGALLFALYIQRQYTAPFIILS